MKRKRVNGILDQLYDLALWPHPWSWPWSFKVRVWNSLISGMGLLIDMERKGCESSFHDPWYWLVWPWLGGQMYRIVTGVTFRRQRAVDISSWDCLGEQMCSVMVFWPSGPSGRSHCSHLAPICWLHSIYLVHSCCKFPLWVRGPQC